MKSYLLLVFPILFSCSSQESEETKQLREQNALLKKQLAATEQKRTTPTPVNYGEKVAGTYIGYYLEDYLHGGSQNLPSKGVSGIRKIHAMGRKKILIESESTNQGLFGAIKASNDAYKAALKPDNEIIHFTEIWETGGYESYGEIDGDELIEYTKRRSDGKLISKLKARK